MSDPNAAGGDGSGSIDASFDALSDPCRRSLCRYAMRTETGPVTRDELTDYIADRATETATTDLDRRAIAMELHHVHLPKLDETGMIEYDPQSGVAYVDRTTVAERLERIRATIADLQDGQVAEVDQ